MPRQHDDQLVAYAGDVVEIVGIAPVQAEAVADVRHAVCRPSAPRRRARGRSDRTRGRRPCSCLGVTAIPVSCRITALRPTVLSDEPDLVRDDAANPGDHRRIEARCRPLAGARQQVDTRQGRAAGVSGICGEISSAIRCPPVPGPFQCCRAQQDRARAPPVHRLVKLSDSIP